ncbi:hypothetical protein ACFFIG_11070 [Paraburkholderia rhizosphaerae]
MPDKGWALSPAFDMNPTADAHGLKLNISEADNAMDLELAFSVAHYFRVPVAAAEEIVERQRRIVPRWRRIAESLGVAARQQERMATAFRLA